MNSYEQKIEERRERLLDKAGATKAQASALINQAHKMAEAIPFGQPILVGHYSEGRDRRYRGRIHNKFEKGFGLADQAKKLAQKADAVGTGGVSSDDPDSIKKLKEQLSIRKVNQERMRAANALIRHNDRTGLLNMGFTEAQIVKLCTPDCGRVGFPSYSFTNNNAQIHRIEQRIAELERNAQREDKIVEGNGYTYHEDTSENRVMFFFSAKPSDQVRDLLKRYAFKFSSSRNNAWVRKLNGNGLYAAKMVREKLDAGDVEAL